MQAEVFSAPISEAVTILSENHHFLDVCELFERRVHFRSNPCICSDPWRANGTAELYCCRPRFRNRALHVQRQGEVRASHRQGCRAIRRATEQGIEFREVPSIAFGEGW